ncbi:TRAP transporter substrate-binding protein [Actinocorallia glomerata]|uniref:TRAP transporter substrate-binding protein n=2 Tax=Actinomycetes TaxID=1760 RepID=A0ABP6LST4_9MICC
MASLALTACGGESGEENIELNVASWATPESISEYMGNWWYQEIEERTDGRLTFNVAAGDSLCSSSEIPECVRDGRADVGQTLTDYSSQLFPMASVASIPFLNPNSFAVTNAIYDLSTEHEGAAQLWDENGLRMIAHVPPGRLLLGGDTELSSLDDLEGLRLRMAGQYAHHAVEAAGASPISLTAPETYEGIERGVADAAGFPLDGLIAYQLKDVLPKWTDPGVGTYTTIGMWINQDVYDGLPDDLREVVDEVTEEFNRNEAARINTEVLTDICDRSLETIGEITQWDEEEAQRWSDELGTSLEELWIEEAERDGLEDPEGYLEAYKEKLDEYQGEVEQDPTIACAERQ